MCFMAIRAVIHAAVPGTRLLCAAAEQCLCAPGWRARAGRQRVKQKNLVIAENYGLSKISLSALCDFAESTWTCWHWIYKLKIINNSNQAVINLRSVSMNLDTIS